MKTLAILVILLNVTLASAKNNQALKLEKLQLEIAKTLSESFQQNGPCGGEIEAYTSDIADVVGKARYYFDFNFEYNNSTKRKFKIDPAVTKTLESTLFLKSIMNMIDNKDLSTLEHALNRVIMWGPAPGAYGNMTYLKFGTNNKVEYWELEIIDEYPGYEWVKTEATFQLQKKDYKYLIEINYKNKVETYFLKQERKSFRSNLWYMVPEKQPNANPYMDGFVDYPSECEA